MNKIPKVPKVLEALIPLVFLIILLVLTVKIFGTDGLSGSNQIVLILSATVAGSIAVFRLGYTWDALQEGVVKSISSAMSSILILFLIGALAGTWLLSGIVPAMIYYGLQVISPALFLFAACFISAIVSTATGSSWTTVATVGVALLGIGKALGFEDGIIAGAIISGAYFGDKMSPLSDTTNLAPAMAGTDLFTHIRHMAKTTIPTMVITLVLFFVIGLNYQTDGNVEDVKTISNIISSNFTLTPWLFLVPAIVIFMIIKKVPALPALLVGALLGGVFALIFQPHIIARVVGEEGSFAYLGFKGVMMAMWKM